MTAGIQVKNGYLYVILTLECAVKALQQQLDEFKSGERYLKLQKDYRQVIADYERTIKNLKFDLSHAHSETVNVNEL